MNHAEIRKEISKLHDRWFEIETKLKDFEFMAGSALTAAVFSLRYAGRQLVRIIMVASKTRKTESEIQQVIKSIEIVNHYLDMAEDDIVDGVVGVINVRLKEWLRDHDEKSILESVPNYITLKANLEFCRKTITETRRMSSESKRREKYRELASDPVPKIAEIYKQIEENGLERAEAIKFKNEEIRRASYAVGELGLAFTALLAIPNVFPIIFGSGYNQISHFVWQTVIFVGLLFLRRFALNMTGGRHVFIKKMMSKYFFGSLMLIYLGICIQYNWGAVVYLLTALGLV